MVQFISFGGAGGCGIGIRLREIGFMAYPFDWMMCAQSFISNYFTKETKRFIDWNAPIDGSFMVHRNINNKIDSIAIHDEIQTKEDRKEIKQKYKRRMKRLKEVLISDETVVFFRVGNCSRYGGLKTIKDEVVDFKSEENWDNEEKWINLIEYLKKKYNRNNIFLFIFIDTEPGQQIRKLSENVFITDQHVKIDVDFILNFLKENSIYL